MSLTTSSTVAPPTPQVQPAPAEATSEGRGIRLRHLWAIAPLAIAWFAAGIDFIEPFDFWWNVKSGEIMAKSGQFLSTDVLVWSPVREPYYNAQWGSQLLFYWLYNVSPYLLLTMRAAIITATVGVVLLICFRRSGALKAATLATLVAYLTSWTNYGMRPQLFAFLPFVLFMLILEGKDERPRLMPLLVPVMLFWVNVHGSFFLGVALLGIYALGTLFERVGSGEGRRWLRSRAAGWQALWVALAVLATLANPYFASIYNYFIVATNDPIARSLNIEWQSPTLSDGTGQLFFLNVLIFAAAAYFGRRRMRPTELLLTIAFGYLALTSLRNVMWWDWATAPILAANFAAWGRRGVLTRFDRGQKSSTPEDAAPRVRTELPAANLVLALLLVGGALIFTPLWREANPLVAPAAKSALTADTPTKLASFLKGANVPAPVFNYMEWGGFLEWELYPSYRMFIDGRFEARQTQVWKDYLSVSRGRADWQQTLDRYGVRTLVLNKKFHSDLILFAGRGSTWRQVYEDKLGVVYMRKQ